jgi:hypothetical protein
MIVPAVNMSSVAIDVDEIDDHRQPELFLVESGPGRRWIDQHEQRALGERVAALKELAERQTTSQG